MAHIELICAINANNMIDRPLLSKRLQSAYDYLRGNGVVHTITEFAEAIGKTQGDVSNALSCRGRVMTIGLLTRVADAFPDVLNRDYLLTGEGEVAAPDKTLKPHVEAKAAAGFMSGFADGDKGDNLKPLQSFFHGYDFTITVEGDSMEPELHSGDALLCRIITDRANLPIGKICVIDSADGAAVKQIKKTAEGKIICHSLNDKYTDFGIDYSDINNIAEVVGVMRAY